MIVIDQTNKLPLAQQNLYNLILQETDGNFSAFAKKVNCSQQMLDMCFRADKQTGKYRQIFPSVKNAVMEKYGFDDSWFLTPQQQSEPIQTLNDGPSTDFIAIIKSLTEANSNHAQANLINAEANKKNAESLERLITMLQK